jgi:hypothetical protein
MSGIGYDERGISMVTVAEGTAVAKKRAKPAEPESERQAVVLTMRGKPEWKTWLKLLSKHCRLKVSVCVEQALMEYAERRGFAEPSPERTD